MFHRIYHLIIFLALWAGSLVSVQSQTLGDAQALYDSGLFEESLEVVDALNIDDPRAWFMKANCLHKLDSYHEALICYRQAAKSGYDGHVLKLFSGICAFSAGYLDEAEASLWQYLGDHPQDAVGLYYMGALEYIRMDNKLSVHYLEMALAIHPEYVDALYLMGANMMERRKYNQAAFWFEKSAEGEDAEPRSALNLALVRIELMDYSGALEILLSLDQSSSDFLPEVLYYLGEVHFALKNHDEACNYWSMASSKGDVDAERNYRNICEHNKKRLRKKRRSYSEF